MQDQTREALNELLDAYDGGVGQQKQFLADFDRARDSVIRPAMEAICERLRERGHVCEVQDEGGDTPHMRAAHESHGITMTVTPAGTAEYGFAPEHAPALSLRGMAYRGIVQATGTVSRADASGGQDNAYGEFTLKELTGVAVEQSIIEFLRVVLPAVTSK